ncbi:hypothetical protein ACIOEW_36775 [Streptomyces sp. NPDC087901]|uniref:hypothetical protein n=1 Tax=Streptomyces sp. NPDC087901 TaxID=3365818 RepID=UPI00380A14D8
MATFELRFRAGHHPGYEKEPASPDADVADQVLVSEPSHSERAMAELLNYVSAAHYPDSKFHNCLQRYLQWYLQ